MSTTVFLRWVVLPGSAGAVIVFGVLWIIGRVVQVDPIEWLDERAGRWVDDRRSRHGV